MAEWRGHYRAARLLRPEVRHPVHQRVEPVWGVPGLRRPCRLLILQQRERADVVHPGWLDLVPGGDRLGAYPLRLAGLHHVDRRITARQQPLCLHGHPGVDQDVPQPRRRPLVDHHVGVDGARRPSVAAPLDTPSPALRNAADSGRPLNR